MKLILALAALCCFILYQFVKFTRRYHKQLDLLKPVPGPPRDNIILGNIHDLLIKPSDFLRLMKERYELYGGITVTWLFTFPFIFIGEAPFAEVFLTSKHLNNKSELYKNMHMWLGQGLLTSGGEKWQKHRKLLTPAFHFSILNTFTDAFTDNSITLIEKLRKSCDVPIDIFKTMGLIALDNLCDTAMGVKVNALKDPKMLSYIRATEEATHTMMERMFKPWYWDDTSFFMLPVGRKMREDLDIVNKLNDRIIEERKRVKAQKQLESKESKNDEISKDVLDNDETKDNKYSGRKKMAFLDLMIEACESEETSFSEQDMKDEVATFMFEGHDTTTSALAFTTWLLGHHLEIQEKCYQELQNIFKGSDRRPTVDDLQNMKYLEQCIKEGLRLFPSVPLLARSVPCDVEMGGYTVPAGSMLVMSLFVLHHDPKYFPDPDKFDPDRFNPENSAGRHPFAYAPFAAGARNCIGQKFAMMELKIVLSYIIRNFTFESAYSQEKLEVVFALIIRSQKSLDMTFKLRKNIQKPPREYVNTAYA